MPDDNFVLYTTEDGRDRIELRAQNGTVWLSLNRIADLFERDKSVISRHIANIFDDRELAEDSVVANFATTAADGKTYQVEYFNLDVIISVGYRVKSRRGVQFRQWATRTLKEHLVQGYTLNQRRLAERGIEFEQAPGRQLVNALEDRAHFFKSCFLFWVLGAIDGHAKNFSIRIDAEGRFQLTPLYDVISAYPLAAKRQVEWNKLKMAMNVQGKNVHYHWKTISLRHWEQTAALCHLPNQSFKEIVTDVFDNMQSVIDEVAANLPKSLPAEIAQSIFDGMNSVKNR